MGKRVGARIGLRAAAVLLAVSPIPAMSGVAAAGEFQGLRLQGYVASAPVTLVSNKPASRQETLSRFVLATGTESPAYEVAHTILAPRNNGAALRVDRLRGGAWSLVLVGERLDDREAHETVRLVISVK